MQLIPYYSQNVKSSWKIGSIANYLTAFLPNFSPTMYVSFLIRQMTGDVIVAGGMDSSLSCDVIEEDIPGFSKLHLNAFIKSHINGSFSSS